MEGVGAQDNPFAMDELLIGLSNVAPRLSGEQAGLLMENLIAEFMKRVGNPAKDMSMMKIVPCLKNLAGLLGPEQAQTSGRRLLDAMQQEKDAKRLNSWYSWYTVAEVITGLDAGQLRTISALLVEAMEQDKTGDDLTGLGWQLTQLKGCIEPPFLHRAAVRLIDAAGVEKDKDRLRFRAEALARIIDRLEAADARRAAETAVDIFLKEKERESGLLTRIAELTPLEGKSCEPTAQALAERVARAIEQAASGVELYVVYEPEQIRNLTTLLRHASDQALLDILKQPCAVGEFQKIMLQVWELKYGQQFDNDLRRFVQWATRDPRTKNLDFHSPPR
jgi:hypothetical protein